MQNQQDTVTKGINATNTGTGIRGLIRGMATLPKVTRSY